MLAFEHAKEELTKLKCANDTFLEELKKYNKHIVNTIHQKNIKKDKHNILRRYHHYN